MIVRFSKLERNKAIVESVVREHLTVAEAARRFGLSQGRISQIVTAHLRPVEVQIAVPAEAWEKLVEQARQRGTNARTMAASLLSEAVEQIVSRETGAA
jgi:transposase-like protein